MMLMDLWEANEVCPGFTSALSTSVPGGACGPGPRICFAGTVGRERG